MGKEIIDKDVAILGAGPAGISAALVLKENNVDFVIIDGSTPGGKVNIAPRVDNYPGFEKIPGPDLAFALFQRLIDQNIEIQGENVVNLTKNGNKFDVECDYHIYHCRAVLVATGTQERKIGLDKEDAMFGHGLSYCALCDGHFFKGQNAAIIGGGNSALKEAIYLAPLVKKLYVIHRRNEFRGTLKNLNELKQFKNVEILTPYIPLKILGDNHVEGLIIQNKEDNSTRALDIQGLFPLVGQNPNTSFIHIDGALDDYRAVPVDKKMMSHIDGLFAAGDVLPRVIKQIYLSEYDGKVAAKAIIEYLK